MLTMHLLPAGFGLFLLLLFVHQGHCMTNSLDRFNDEDIAELGEEPQKPSDRGFLLDKIFNKKRMMPGNQASSINTQSWGGYDGQRYTGANFNIMQGDDVFTGLNYGRNTHWGNGMGGGGAGFFGSALGQPYMLDGPYAGPPMFIQPAPPQTTTASSKEGPSTASTGEDSSGSTTASPGGSTTMRPQEKADALVKAFGGGEKPRIQQMGPPIIVPMGSVPGLNGIAKMSGQQQVLKPGEQMPMYGRIVLGPPKFAQSVGAGNRGGGMNRYGGTSGGFTLVRYNKPDSGINYSFGTGREDTLGSGNNRYSSNTVPRRAGFRSVEPFQEPERPKPPPVVKYVPVVEIVKRRRMKAVLADPI